MEADVGTTDEARLVEGYLTGSENWGNAGLMGGIDTDGVPEVIRFGCGNRNGREDGSDCVIG
jgi:hypothetical protein